MKAESARRTAERVKAKRKRRTVTKEAKALNKKRKLRRAKEALRKTALQKLKYVFECIRDAASKGRFKLKHECERKHQTIYSYESLRALPDVMAEILRGNGFKVDVEYHSIPTDWDDGGVVKSIDGYDLAISWKTRNG